MDLQLPTRSADVRDDNEARLSPGVKRKSDNESVAQHTIANSGVTEPQTAPVHLLPNHLTSRSPTHSATEEQQHDERPKKRRAISPQQSYRTNSGESDVSEDDIRTQAQLQAQRLDEAYNKGYQHILNNDIRGAFFIHADTSVETDAEFDPDLEPSCIGGTLWTSNEKEVFFSALACYGRNLHLVAAAVRKSVLEVSAYVDLLVQSLQTQRMKYEPDLDMADVEGAMEVSSDMEDELEFEDKADAIAWRQYRKDIATEIERYGYRWLLVADDEKMAGLEAKQRDLETDVGAVAEVDANAVTPRSRVEQQTREKTGHEPHMHREVASAHASLKSRLEHTASEKDLAELRRRLLAGARLRGGMDSINNTPDEAKTCAQEAEQVLLLLNDIQEEARLRAESEARAEQEKGLLVEPDEIGDAQVKEEDYDDLSLRPITGRSELSGDSVGSTPRSTSLQSPLGFDTSTTPHRGQSAPITSAQTQQYPHARFPSAPTPSVDGGSWSPNPCSLREGRSPKAARPFSLHYKNCAECRTAKVRCIMREGMLACDRCTKRGLTCYYEFYRGRSTSIKPPPKPGEPLNRRCTACMKSNLKCQRSDSTTGACDRCRRKGLECLTEDRVRRPRGSNKMKHIPHGDARVEKDICTECQYVKLRCVTEGGTDAPCERCALLKLDCIFGVRVARPPQKVVPEGTPREEDEDLQYEDMPDPRVPPVPCSECRRLKYKVKCRIRDPLVKVCRRCQRMELTCVFDLTEWPAESEVTTLATAARAASVEDKGAREDDNASVEDKGGREDLPSCYTCLKLGMSCTGEPPHCVQCEARGMQNMCTFVWINDDSNQAENGHMHHANNTEGMSEVSMMTAAELDDDFHDFAKGAVLDTRNIWYNRLDVEHKIKYLPYALMSKKQLLEKYIEVGLRQKKSQTAEQLAEGLVQYGDVDLNQEELLAQQEARYQAWRKSRNGRKWWVDFVGEDQSRRELYEPYKDLLGVEMNKLCTLNHIALPKRPTALECAFLLTQQQIPVPDGWGRGAGLEEYKRLRAKSREHSASAPPDDLIDPDLPVFSSRAATEQPIQDENVSPSQGDQTVTREPSVVLVPNTQTSLPPHSTGSVEASPTDVLPRGDSPSIPQAEEMDIDIPWGGDTELSLVEARAPESQALVSSQIPVIRIAPDVAANQDVAELEENDDAAADAIAAAMDKEDGQSGSTQELLDHRSMLRLSRDIFLNSTDKSQNWSEYVLQFPIPRTIAGKVTGHDCETLLGGPAMFRSAYEDFSSLIRDLTKRIVTAAYHITCRRMRDEDDGAGKPKPYPVCQVEDVHAALEILGLKQNAWERWATLPQRHEVKWSFGFDEHGVEVEIGAEMAGKCLSMMAEEMREKSFLEVVQDMKEAELAKAAVSGAGDVVDLEKDDVDMQDEEIGVGEEDENEDQSGVELHDSDDEVEENRLEELDRERAETAMLSLRTHLLRFCDRSNGSYVGSE